MRVTRREFVAAAGAAVGAGLLGCTSGRKIRENSVGDRVIFVCRDQQGDYSPGVYLHGGGEEALDILRAAAPQMRAGNPGDSAAGLCGHLLCSYVPGGASLGYVSLLDAPAKDADGNVDWEQYSHGDAGVVIIDVDRRSAECRAGYLEGQTVDALPLPDA